MELFKAGIDISNDSNELNQLESAINDINNNQGAGYNWRYLLSDAKAPDGFAGTPQPVTLKPGTQIDRYGGNRGSFVAPRNTPYGQRSLAPGSDKSPYNAYEVVKPIDAAGGKTAPWFNQPGGGTQYKFNQSIQELLDGGYIRKVD